MCPKAGPGERQGEEAGAGLSWHTRATCDLGPLSVPSHVLWEGRVTTGPDPQEDEGLEAGGAHGWAFGAPGAGTGRLLPLLYHRLFAGRLRAVPPPLPRGAPGQPQAPGVPFPQPIRTGRSERGRPGQLPARGLLRSPAGCSLPQAPLQPGSLLPSSQLLSPRAPARRAAPHTTEMRSPFSKVSLNS